MTTVSEAPTTTASQNGGRETFEVRNPATGEQIADVRRFTAEEVAEAARRGRSAQPDWETIGFSARAEVLGRVQRRLIADADRVIDTLVAESGKTRDDASNLEIAYTTLAINFWRKNAADYLADEKVKSGSPFAFGKRLAIRYEPHGLVGVIGPWNYPLANSFGDCIPALMAGNAVMLKPASATPLTSVLMAEIAHDCGVPADIFQVITGPGATAEALIDSVDMVMFTGSTETGKRVMKQAADTLTPVSLELGGKDAMIVLADADLERAADFAVQYGICNAGQTCLAIERVYVEEAAHDELVTHIGRKVKALRTGPPGPMGASDVGSLTTEDQAEIVSAHIRDAVEKGAKVLTGGGRHDRIIEPTVLVDVDHTMECMTEETFGPTLPVMKVRDADEALRLANDSPYGLAGSVFGGDEKRAEAVARRIEAGTVSVNDALSHYGALELPMGGWKTSGVGSRHGKDGIRKYCRRQSVLVSHFHPMRDPHFFPNRKSRTMLVRRVIKAIYGRGRD